MTMAALPDHNRLTDPLWLKLFRNYHHLITALRHNGWVTDVETCGGEFNIRADLGNGAELVIHCGDALPIDPTKVPGWIMVRQEQPDAQNMTALYDSTPEGPQAHHGTSLIPLLSRIDALNLTTARAHTSASFVTPQGVPHHQTGPVEATGTAVARLYEWGQQLVTAEGYRQVWERPENDGYPLAVLEHVGHIATLRVTPWHD
ncbi:hypothetical protein [Streptomyces sp. NBC_01187]|uniref:hypothetical protein n=1 Tax=Streptomyces sp. NBC_01187 TaxID=2903766 RepID=UPI003863544E|nr:hypothetical protein OG220_11735 [Streptomyces sp. NBC_01187]